MVDYHPLNARSYIRPSIASGCSQYLQLLSIISQEGAHDAGWHLQKSYIPWIVQHSANFEDSNASKTCSGGHKA